MLVERFTVGGSIATRSMKTRFSLTVWMMKICLWLLMNNGVGESVVSLYPICLDVRGILTH